MLKLVTIFSIFTFSVFADYQSVATSLNGSSSHVDGPNCWNGALYAVGVLKTKRFMHPDEWLLHLKNHCEEVESPLAGDVGRLYHPDDGEVHGFVHLNTENIFAKHGESLQHGYQIMSYAEMLKQYGKTRDCRIRGDDSPECHHLLKYYRCDSEESFPVEVTNINELLEELVFSAETKWRYKENCEGEIFKKREEVIDEITQEVKKWRSSVNNSDYNSSLTKALLESYSQQIYNVEVSQRNFRCVDRAKKKRAIKALRDEMRPLRDLFK